MVMLVYCLEASAQKHRRSQMKDSVLLGNVTVTGKSKTQRLREGALTVNAIDVRSLAASLSNVNDIIDRTAGVKIREEGGMGSDFDLSINGMSGNSVRYFIDGVPLDTKGSGITLANLPVSIVDRVEIYKGVVPIWLSSDALGGAVNIVTNRRKSNYLDASYGIGSFHTHRVDVNGQYILENGLTLRPTLGVSYSKNDYMMKGVELWDEDSRKYLPQNRRRFHDDFLSLLGQLEAGIIDKAWADECFVHIFYNKMEKDIQTGQIQTRVVGMAERSSEAWGIGASYRKQRLLTDGLSLSAQLSHTWDHSITTDTASRQYDWNGDYIYSARNELNGRSHALRHYRRPLTIARVDLDYDLTALCSKGNQNPSGAAGGASHSLNLSYAMNRTGNDRWDDVDKSFERANDVLAKHIIGLAYNQTLLSGHINNTLFVKDYMNHLTVEQTDIPTVTGSRDVLGSNTKNYVGYGIGTRLQLWEPLAMKASYEHSIRLPLARELLGNGTTIYANMALQPESSNNVNVGLFGTLKNADHTFSYEVNGFLRQSEDYIQAQVSEKEGTMQYVNVPSVHIKGLEGELRYDWRQRLQAVGNISWQDARDRQRLKNDGKPSVTYNNHVPNRPWLFGSAEVRYDLAPLISAFAPQSSASGRLPGKDTHLYVGLDYQWVHWFFLSWEGYGNKDTKARIPEKNIVGAELTCSWQQGRYSLSLQCENLLDATVYDNYKLQKPGRAFFAKFRLFLNKQ